LNGGINDVGVATILNPLAPVPSLGTLTRRACYEHMGDRCQTLMSTSQKDLTSAEVQVEEAHAKEAGSLAGAPDKGEPFFPRNAGAALIQSRLHASSKNATWSRNGRVMGWRPARSRSRCDHSVPVR
jgi:hypothetical protein